MYVWMWICFSFGGWLLWWYCIFTIPHEFYSMQIMFGRFIFGVGSQWFFFLQTWNLNLRTKCFGVLAIYFHGLKGRNPNHEQKQNQITKETARDTHLSHSSIPPDNTLRIINCTNRIISMSKKLCACLEKSAFFKKYFTMNFPKNAVWESPYGTVLEKLWPLANIDMSPSEKNINSVLRGFDQNKIYEKIFPRWERGIRFLYQEISFPII